MGTVDNSIDQVIGTDVNATSQEISGAKLLSQNPSYSERVMSVVSKVGGGDGEVSLEVALPDPSGNHVWAEIFSSRTSFPVHRTFPAVSRAIYRFRVIAGGSEWRVQLSG